MTTNPAAWHPSAAQAAHAAAHTAESAINTMRNIDVREALALIREGKPEAATRLLEASVTRQLRLAGGGTVVIERAAAS